jgi:hypothetical protein
MLDFALRELHNADLGTRAWDSEEKQNSTAKEA